MPPPGATTAAAVRTLFHVLPQRGDAATGTGTGTGTGTATMALLAAVKQEHKEAKDELFDVLKVVAVARGFASKGQRDEALGTAMGALVDLVALWEKQESGWLNGAVKALVSDAVVLSRSRAADGSSGAAAASSSSSAARLLETITTKLFAKLQSSAVEGTESKQWLVAYMVNTALRLHFRLHKANMIERTVMRFYRLRSRAGSAAPIETLGMAVRVEQAFFFGRLALMSNQHAEAERFLGFAYENTPRGHANKRRALERLVPLRLARGKAPSLDLLRRSGLVDKYVGLMVGVVEGDAARVEREIERHATYFASLDVLAVVRRLVWVSHRSTLRRRARAEGTGRVELHAVALVPPDGAGAVPGLALSNALAMDATDKLECVVSNLVASGLVRGYVVHEPPHCLVLDQKDPFPSLRAAVVRPWARGERAFQ